MSKVSKILAGVLTLAVASVSFGASTVSALNPLQVEGTAFGQVQNSPSGVLNPSFIPFATFKTQVAAAFAADTGGVMNFNEQSTGGSFPPGTFGAPGSPFPVTFGTSQTFSVGIDRTSAVAGDVLDAGTGNNTVYASGTSYLGFSGTTTPGLRLTPLVLPAGFGITAVGFTILERGALRTPTVTIQLDDASIVAVGGPDAIPNAGPSNFYSYQAPAGRTISVINYVAPDGALRVDDLGFITSAVPEPTSLALLGLGGIAALRRRRA